MLRPTDWHPVAATPTLHASDNVVAARVLGQDLVLWRSAAGVAQAWHDRCPHRGTRLSLGRIVDGRLCCAYHGWEFAADSGRCVAIPALADLARLPGHVCARTCMVAESQQMVWVRLEPDPRMAAAAGPGAPQSGAAPVSFLRSLAVRAPARAVLRYASRSLPPLCGKNLRTPPIRSPRGAGYQLRSGISGAHDYCSDKCACRQGPDDHRT